MTAAESASSMKWGFATGHSRASPRVMLTEYAGISDKARTLDSPVEVP
jgi:hypothetical protein